MTHSRVMPYPVVYRQYRRVYDSELEDYVYRPEDGGTVTAEDRSGNGAVGAAPDTLPGSSITVPFDANGQALVFWRPMPASGGRAYLDPTFSHWSNGIDPGTPNLAVGSTTAFSATVAPLEGTTADERTLAADGVALAQEGAVVLRLGPSRMPLWVKVETDELAGGDDDKGIWADEVFNLGSPWRRSGKAIYLWLPPPSDGGTVRTVSLPLDHDSDGAEVTVTAVYARNFWTSGDYRKASAELEPPKKNQEVVLDEFKFKVGCFRIESINFLSGIDLFSGFAPAPYWFLPGVEWMRNGRRNPPTTAHWKFNTSAPAAIVMGDSLKLELSYTCRGLSGVTLSANCSNPDSSSPSCPFGNIDADSVDCAKTTGNFISTATATSISASMNSFKWRVNSTEVSVPIEVENSVHRIYSVFQKPTPLSLLNGYPWIELLELSTANLSQSSANNCEALRIELGDNFYFNRWLNKIITSVQNSY